MAGSTDRRLGIAGLAALVAVSGLGGLAVARLRQPVASPGGVELAVVPDATGRPNVLFIVWDTTRADRMSVYGNPLPTTPRIAEYAKQAVVYERAYSPDMWTMPSHSALFTGLPTSTHGVTSDHRWLDEMYLTLPEHLAAAGYDTYGFTANQFASSNCNLFQGIATEETSWQGKWAAKSKAATREKRIADDRSTEISPAWVPPAGEPNMMWDRGLAKDAGPIAHQAVTGWIDEKGNDKPWFAFINMMEAHWPRVPSEKARRQVMEQATYQKGLETDATLFTALSYTLGKHEYTPDELAAQVAVYDATLVDLDQATGDLLDDLKQRGVLDNTIVVITADHGEYLGDHHMFDHRYGLYDSMIHVPLIVHYPKGAPARRVSEPVSTAGIWTEVVKLTGLQLPADDWKRATLDTPQTSPVFSEFPVFDSRALGRFVKHYPELDLKPWQRTLDSAVDGAYKLISYHDHVGTELYDVVADPGETNNLATAQPEKTAEIQAKLDAWRASVRKYDPSGAGAGDGEKVQTLDERRMMVELGYLDELFPQCAGLAGDALTTCERIATACFPYDGDNLAKCETRGKACVEKEGPAADTCFTLFEKQAANWAEKAGKGRKAQ